MIYVKKFKVMPVDISVICDIADNKKEVDPWELTYAVESLYKGIKVMGINNVEVMKLDSTEGKHVVLKGIEMSERSRAVAELVVRILYRFSDYNSGRLEKHFGLTTKLEILLYDVKEFQPSGFGATLQIMSIQDLVRSLTA